MATRQSLRDCATFASGLAIEHAAKRLPGPTAPVSMALGSRSTATASDWFCPDRPQQQVNA